MVVDIFSSKGSHMPFSRMLPDVLEELGHFCSAFCLFMRDPFSCKTFPIQTAGCFQPHS